MAALKDASEPRVTIPPAGTAARGRDNYSLYSVLRTKPGRADSPPTSCMSCSDKIASWNVLGFQGALVSALLPPLYISTIIIGDVLQESMVDFVMEDCSRAFWKRIGGLQGSFLPNMRVLLHTQHIRMTIELLELPVGFQVHQPRVCITSISFPHSRSCLASGDPGPLSPCNECRFPLLLISLALISR